MLCYVVIRYDMSCHLMLRYVMLCYVMYSCMYVYIRIRTYNRHTTSWALIEFV